MIPHTSDQKHKQPQRLWALTLISVVMLGAVATREAIALPQPSRPATAELKKPQSVQARLPQQVAQRVQRDLAQRLNVAPRTLKIVSFSREIWGDSCLGLAADNERCAMATVEGWRVEVTNGQENWFYRTDLKAQVIKLETKDRASLPPQITERLLQTIAKQEGVPASSLRILETRSATWDGCMGIYVPNQACTRIAISGRQVIIAGNQQTWVYHISEDASRIVKNPTASGSRGNVMVSFLPRDGQPTPTNDNVVFRFTVSGGLAGIVTETFLTTDGTIYRQTRRFNTPTTGQPTVVKRLSQQQVSQFQQMLQQQRFPNLNGLRYLTDAALADYPTTTLQAMGSTVEYIDLEKDNLPQALRTVIQSWERL